MQLVLGLEKQVTPINLPAANWRTLAAGLTAARYRVTHGHCSWCSSRAYARQAPESCLDIFDLKLWYGNAL